MNGGLGMTEKVRVGNLYIGGGESVKKQSMCTVKTSRVDEVCAQIAALEAAGCELSAYPCSMKRTRPQ